MLLRYVFFIRQTWANFTNILVQFIDFWIVPLIEEMLSLIRHGERERESKREGIYIRHYIDARARALRHFREMH